MNVEFNYSDQLLVLDFYPDDNDLSLIEGKARMNNRSCFFQLPVNIEDNIHPDLLGLSVVLCTNPFTKNEFNLPFPISKTFQDVIKKCLKKEIGPVDINIKPRKVESGRPALCYSGGVDSTAALAIMPDDTVSYFVDRIIPKNKKVLYNKFAAHKAVSDVKEKGYEIYSIPTNFEYLRTPVGFPVDVSTAIPAILSADAHSIDSVAFGMTLNGVYRVGHAKFLEYKNRSHYKTWGAIFESVSLDFFLATSGMTDIGNYIISKKFNITDFARSCMRGGESAPCMKCLKCFRKLTIESIIDNEKVEDDDINKMLNTKEVLLTIGKRDIKLENIYRYISYKLKDENAFAEILGRKINIEEENVEWMEKWFPDSIDLIPFKYRDDFTKKVGLYLNSMSEGEVDFVRKWESDLYPRSGGHEEWVEFLISKIQNEKLKSYLEL